MGEDEKSSTKTAWEQNRLRTLSAYIIISQEIQWEKMKKQHENCMGTESAEKIHPVNMTG